MNKVASAFSSIRDSEQTGRDIGRQLNAQLPEADALIVFCSSRHNYEQLLITVASEFKTKHLVGCSSAGEFTGKHQGEGSVSAFAIWSDEMVFASGLGKELSFDQAEAARTLLQGFRSEAYGDFQYHYALILNDALAGYAEELIQELNVQTGGRHQLFGGGAGDDAAFKKTHVFHGSEAHTNAAVGLQILSNKPLGIGVRHGWVPATPLYRVTQSSGPAVQSLNTTAAGDVMVEYAQQSGQHLDLDEPLPFLLHNILGIKTELGYKLRVPLGFGKDGSLACAAEVPKGVAVSIMSADGTSSAHAAAEAAEDAVAQLEGNKPGAALFFDCVATRLRVGKGFGDELNAVERTLGSVPLVGCNTYGQISRVDGQANGFHNCTAVICVFPE